MSEGRERISTQEGSTAEATNGRIETDHWTLEVIDWGFVFRQQHYGTLLFTLFPCLALALILWVFDVEPELDVDVIRILQNQDYDNPKKSGSIPAVVAVSVPLIIFLVILFLGELLIFKSHHKNITNAVYVILYFFISWFCAFAVHIVAQQISAIVVAEPRPDYADRCQVNEAGACAGNAEDGLRSFFSGHASSAILSAVYSSIYLLWLVYFRQKPPCGALPLHHLQKTWRDRLKHEFVHGMVLYLIVIQLGFSWAIGITRVIDNRHHIWDVTCGLFVGTVVAAFFALHAIAALPYMPKKES